MRFDAPARNLDRHADFLRKITTELLVAVGGLPELVIEMGQADDGEVPVFREVGQQGGQPHRVGAARERNQHTGAWRAEPEAANRAADLLMERGQQR